ncbi:MAG: IS1182 family transposase [Rubrobacteraceae bacterium]
MMGIKERNFRPLPDNLSLEALVPRDNFYRRLQERVDLSFVRELVLPLYAKGGRHSIDPVVFFKLQLVLFFENLRSERQLMEVVAARLSLRWYLGYDLDERLPDHSSLTKIRERYGVRVFRRFFERIVEECVEAGLVRGEELFIDSTKIEANAAVDSLAPRWFVETHLDDLFDGDSSEDSGEDEKTSAEDPSDTQDARGPEDEGSARYLPTAKDEDLLRRNRASEDWISRDGAQDRSFEGTSWRERTADTRASRTDPDATPMRWSENARKLGYQTSYVVDGGKARIILSTLVTPGEVSENRPMLDLLLRSAFRWKLRPHHVTADGKYGTAENIKAVEHSGIRAYLALHEAGGRVGFFRKSEFAYDVTKDLYVCPAGQTLRALGDARDIRSRGKTVTYRARASTCAECPLKPQCTTNKNGRSLRRSPKDEYIDLIRAYEQTEPYRKALRKRKVWVEPLFAEGKLWHGMRRFRTRRLEKVNTEALVTATGQNIKRLLTFGGRGPKKFAQASALQAPDRSWPDLSHRTSKDHRRKRPIDSRFSTGWLDRGTDPDCPGNPSRNIETLSRNPVPIVWSQYLPGRRFLGQWAYEGWLHPHIQEGSEP